MDSELAEVLERTVKLIERGAFLIKNNPGLIPTSPDESRGDVPPEVIEEMKEINAELEECSDYMHDWLVDNGKGDEPSVKYYNMRKQMREAMSSGAGNKRKITLTTDPRKV